MARCITCEGEGAYTDDYGDVVNCPDCVKGRERELASPEELEVPDQKEDS